MKPFTLLLILAALVLPGVAQASAGSTCQAYNPQLCGVSAGSSPSPTTSQLPFTGMDVILLLAGGFVLTAAGVVVRRLTGIADPHRDVSVSAYGPDLTPPAGLAQTTGGR